MGSNVVNLTNYISKGTIEYFTNAVAPLTKFSYNVDSNGLGIGDVVRVYGVQNTSGSSAFTYAAGYSGQGAITTGKQITLSNCSYVPAQFSDTEMGQITPEVVQRITNQNMKRLASDMISGSFTNITTANFPTQAAWSSSAFTSSVAWASLANSADVAAWDDNRTVIANNTAYNYFRSNSSLVNYSYGSPVVQMEGVLPKYFGFDLFRVGVFPSNGETLSAFAAHPSGLLVAMGVHSPPADSGVMAFSTLKDNESGLAVGLVQYYDHVHRTTYLHTECLYGIGLGWNNGIIRIVA
jgi:hypothetical protein